MTTANLTFDVPDDDLGTWQREEIKKGLEEMRAGKLIDHADVVTRRVLHTAMKYP
jgi:predicted transcriptional regulator